MSPAEAPELPVTGEAAEVIEADQVAEATSGINPLVVVLPIVFLAGLGGTFVAIRKRGLA